MFTYKPGRPGRLWVHYLADLVKYLADGRLSPPGALSFVYTWVSAPAAPARVEIGAVSTFPAVTPHVQNSSFPGEVQVSAGEVYISLVLSN